MKNFRKSKSTKKKGGSTLADLAIPITFLGVSDYITKHGTGAFGKLVKSITKPITLKIGESATLLKKNKNLKKISNKIKDSRNKLRGKIRKTSKTVQNKLKSIIGGKKN